MSRKKYKFIKSHSTISSRSRKPLKTLSVLFTLFIGLGIVGYIGLTNHVASSGFLLRDLEHRAEELRSENEALEFKAHQLTTSTFVESRLEHLPFQKVSEIEYLSMSPSQVAVR